MMVSSWGATHIAALGVILFGCSARSAANTEQRGGGAQAEKASSAEDTNTSDSGAEDTSTSDGGAEGVESSALDAGVARPVDTASSDTELDADSDPAAVEETAARAWVPVTPGTSGEGAVPTPPGLNLADECFTHYWDGGTTCELSTSCAGLDMDVICAEPTADSLQCSCDLKPTEIFDTRRRVSLFVEGPNTAQDACITAANSCLQVEAEQAPYTSGCKIVSSACAEEKCDVGWLCASEVELSAELDVGVEAGDYAEALWSEQWVGYCGPQRVGTGYVLLGLEQEAHEAVFEALFDICTVGPLPPFEADQVTRCYAPRSTGGLVDPSVCTMELSCVSPAIEFGGHTIAPVLTVGSRCMAVDEGLACSCELADKAAQATLTQGESNFAQDRDPAACIDFTQQCSGVQADVEPEVEL